MGESRKWDKPCVYVCLGVCVHAWVVVVVLFVLNICGCVQVEAGGCCWGESSPVTIPPYSLRLYLLIKLRACLFAASQLALGISLTLSLLRLKLLMASLPIQHLYQILRSKLQSSSLYSKSFDHWASTKSQAWPFGMDSGSHLPERNFRVSASKQAVCVTERLFVITHHYT